MSRDLESTEPTLQRTSVAMLTRLSAMMFLQYWPLGLWGVTVGTYIAANTGAEGAGIFSSGFVGYSTTASAIGSLLAPLLIGFLSDRFFAAEKLLILTHLGCAASAWGMHEARSELLFYVWLLVYWHCFFPSITLTNKISLHHLANSDVEYPRLRLSGTFGWIASGLFVGFAWPSLWGDSIEATRVPLMLGAVSNLLMAGFCLTLPRTPPEPREGSSLATTLHDSRALLKKGPLVLFMLVSILACMPSMAYNNFANVFLNQAGYPSPAALMTLGQVSDLLMLAALPWFVTRFGLGRLFAAGIAFWGVRYALLVFSSSSGAEWATYAAILVHGPCYVFIYVAGVMYVDQLTSDDLRGAAQGLYAVASTGLGSLLGAVGVGYAQQRFLTPEGVTPAPYDWPWFWAIPLAVCVVALLLFLQSSRRFHSTRKV